MKKFLFLLLAMIALMSCQDDYLNEVKDYTYNPETVIMTELVDVSVLTEKVNELRNGNVELKYVEDGVEYEVLYPKNSCELLWDTTLYKAAQLQCDYMYETDVFDHFWLDGTSPQNRVGLVKGDIIFYSIGENIAKMYNDSATEEAVIQAWRMSNGHLKNMKNNTFNTFAVAKKGRYWTMVLANKP